MPFATPTMTTTITGTSNNNAANTDVELGEETPLLSTSSASEPQPLPELAASSLKEQVVTATAGVGFFTSLFALLFQSATHPTVMVSGLLGVILAPYAAFQQRKLTQVQALQQVNERMEQEVLQFTTENEQLKTNIRTMQESVLNLQAMEETLDTMRELSDQSVQELEKQLRESQDILASMDQNYKAGVLQNLISVLLSGDDDGDMILSDEEMDEFIHNLEGINGVELNEEKLRQVIVSQGRSIAALMEVARHLLLSENIPPEENIFAFVENTK